MESFMENRNIYKTDDILIIASFLMLIPAVFFAWPLLSRIPQMEEISQFLEEAPVILGARMQMIFLYLAGAALAQLAGRIIRKKEKESLTIIDYMLYSRDMPVSKVASATGLSESRVRTLVRQLEKIPSVKISLQGERVLWGSSSGPDLGAASSIPPSYESPSAQSSESSPVDPPSGQNSETLRETHSSSHFSYTVNGEKKEMPPEIRAIMQDKSIGMLEKIKRVQEVSGAHSMEDLAKMVRNNPQSLNSSSTTIKSDMTGSNNGKKPGFSPIVMIILMITPLWPLGLFLLFRFIIKQKKELAEKSGQAQ